MEFVQVLSGIDSCGSCRQSGLGEPPTVSLSFLGAVALLLGAFAVAAAVGRKPVRSR